MKKIISITIIFLFVFSIKAQEEIERTNILFVLDASFSMRKNWETKSKWTIAKETLVDVADSLKARMGDNVYFGIRAYGHQSMPVKNDCKDSELILQIANNSISTLKSTLEGISPKGITPLAYSLQQTQTDFKGYKGKNILILITDGVESCKGDPCNILRILIDNKIILKPFVIGVNIPIASLQAYACIGAAVYSENSQKDFKKNLQRSIDKALTYTSLQVNLLDTKNQATQSNKTMFFYRKKDNKLKYTFYHKLNMGVSDTLYLEPDEYSVEVQSIPPVVSEYFTLAAAKHNIVNLKVPTGTLQFITTNVNGETISLTKPSKYLIKKQGENDYLHQEYFENEQSYLVGKYDVDILSLPPIQTTIEIKDKEQKVIAIPAPGFIHIKSKYPLHGAFFIKNVESLINIYSLKPNTTQELLALQPGNYELVFRFSKERKMMKTKTIAFTIKASTVSKIEL